MPSIADSLERAGYLNQLQGGVRRLMKKSEEENNQDQFNQLMQEAMNSLRKTYSSQPEENPSWNMNIAPPQSELGKQIAPRSDKMDMSDDPGNQLGLKVKPKAPGIDIEDPDVTLDDGGEFLGNVTGRKYGGSKDEQRMKQDQIYSDFMQKASRLKGVDQTALNNGLKNLQLQGSAYTPGDPEKPEYKQFDTDKLLYKINSMGDLELVREGVPDPLKQSWKSIGSYTGDDGYQYVRIIGNDGIVKEVKSANKVKPPKGTVINFKPPKSEKWRDFGAYVNSIDYKENPDTGAIELNTPEERKIKRDLAKNQAIGNMLPRAINWYNTEIKNKWNAENISMADFEKEIQESYAAGELSADEAQDLLDMNQYRPYLFDMLRDTARDVEGVEE